MAAGKGVPFIHFQGGAGSAVDEHGPGRSGAPTVPQNGYGAWSRARCVAGQGADLWLGHTTDDDANGVARYLLRALDHVSRQRGEGERGDEFGKCFKFYHRSFLRTTSF